MTEALFIGVGLVFVIEGLLYAAWPGLMKRMVATMLAQSDDQLRLVGVVALAAGVAIVWATRASAGF